MARDIISVVAIDCRACYCHAWRKGLVVSQNDGLNKSGRFNNYRVFSLKQNINTGVYGWRQPHWLENFYPHDLPVSADEDWRLAYYSNEFNAVLVPVDYWHPENRQASASAECEQWLDDVHDEFRFYVECHPRIFELIALPELIAALEIIKPQLSGLVFLQGVSMFSPSDESRFRALSDALQVNIYLAGLTSAVDITSDGGWKSIWQQQQPVASDLAFIENDLSDLRAVRKIIDDFSAAIESFAAENTVDESDKQSGIEATIIINHADIRADKMSELRKLLDIMGY